MAGDTQGRAQERFLIASAQTSLGWVGIAVLPEGLAALVLGHSQKAALAELRSRFPAARLESGDPRLVDLIRAVVAALENPQQAADLPLAPRGTPFQHSVWQALRTIPPGSTVTYGELAAWIGAPKAVRAVAAACGANPLAVLVPCHRVIGRDGSLTGYRWGLERKRELLERESSQPALPFEERAGLGSEG